MIPLPAEVKEWLQSQFDWQVHTDLGNYLLWKRLVLHANIEICSSFKSFAGGT